jgi:hypothetical protein
LKKELSDLGASERDLRRVFDADSGDVITAEKLTFVLEGLDKLKVRGLLMRAECHYLNFALCFAGGIIYKIRRCFETASKVRG